MHKNKNYQQKILNSVKCDRSKCNDKLVVTSFISGMKISEISKKFNIRYKST